MASMKTIQIPAEVKLSIVNQAKAMAGVSKELQDIFANVDPGSSFAKSLIKAFNKIDNKLFQAENLLGGEFFSEADLRKVVGSLTSVAEIVREIDMRAQNAKVQSFLDLDLSKVEAAEQRVKELTERIKTLRGAKVGSILSADSADLKEFSKLSKVTGFSGGKSYSENFKSMEAALGRTAEKYSELITKANEAEEAVKNANEELAKAKVDLNTTNGTLEQRKQLNMEVARNFYGKGSIATSGQGRNRETVKQDYINFVDGLMKDGAWVENGENYAHIIAGWLDIKESDLTGTAENIVTKLKSAISAAMMGKGFQNNALRVNAKSVLDQEQEALRKDAAYAGLQDKVNTSTAHVQIASDGADAALNNLSSANDALRQTESLMAQIRTQMERLSELQKAYNSLINAQNADEMRQAREELQKAIDDAKKEKIDASGKASREAGQLAFGGRNTAGDYFNDKNIKEANEKARKAAEDEAKQFTDNLKKSISHWMSAQQVINLVKDGIRQAYQDIKGLDTAMTNIAVVTDMSVSDLWGKINEYMSIAQQYGVTTQGVYEVSQLYYQQGLSTNEVMAATTETLKMARIAGMGYAEAADAMTVAIRAFKMEMTDAEHVTDVYSKVAAVTASDSEELAIAMSKTASSAESVGSSFENTTAMLAVMIETTRESAQNLGSALKSIISRYGEMKVGLTVDSEGEEIDYNKVDTALKSVGISIKDAQGQFRDFDDVIFELSAKWDSLDKNTQRYIATIMAGNRQQSRFIALVDNWERLDEVAGAAQDSEDAGLLQYAKTLDSLDTKLNNLKTSFQSFYMSIFNGEFFKGAVDLANNLIQSFSRLGPLLGSINLLQLINQIKIIGQLIVQSLSGGLSKITKAKNEWQKEFTNGWESVGDKIGDIIAKAIQRGAEEGAKKASNAANGSVTNSSTQQGQTTIQPTKAQTALSSMTTLMQNGTNINNNSLAPLLASFRLDYENQAAQILQKSDASESDKKWATTVENAGKKFELAVKNASDQEIAAAQEEYIKEVAAADEAAQKLKQGASQASQELSGWQKFQKWGSTKTGQNVGRAAYTVGTLATSAGIMMDQSTMAGYDWSTGLQAAGGAVTAVGQFITGDVVGGVITAITTASSVIKRIVDRDKVELENLEKAATEANVKRAEAKENTSNLEQTINNLRDLEKARYESEEANQAFLDASKAAAEAFPELAQKMDESGQMIVDVSSNATNAERLLYEARQKSADAAIAASAAELAANAKKSENTQKEVDKYSVSETFSDFDILTGRKTKLLEEEAAKTLSPMAAILANLFGSEYENSLEQNYDINTETYNNYHDSDDADKIKLILQAIESAGIVIDETMTAEESMAWIIEELNKESGIFSEFISSLNTGATKENFLNDLEVKARSHGALTDEQGINDWRANYNNAVQADEDQDLKTQASLRAAVIDEANADFLALDKEQSSEWLTEVVTSRNMMWEMVWNIADIDLENDVDANNKLTQDAKDRIQKATTSAKEAWDKYYTNNIGNIEELNEIISASIKGTISASEAAEKFGILSKEDGAVEAAYIRSFYENDAKYRSNLLRGAGITVAEGYGSLEEYRQYTGNENASAQQYLGALNRQIRGQVDQSLLDFLMNGAVQDVAEYVKINSEIQKAIESTGDGFGATALKERDKLVKAIYTASMNKDTGFFANIADDAEAYAEFMEIFTTDIGTSDWAEKLQTFMDKHDMKWEDLGIEGLTAASAVFENYQIRLQSDIESAIAVNEKVNELFSKQEKGFSWDESQALLKEYQKASNELNVGWANLFEVNEEGAIVLKDISKVLDTLYQNEIDTLDGHRDNISSIIDSLNNNFAKETRIDNALLKVDIKNRAQVEGAARALSYEFGLNLDDSQLEQLANAIESGAIESYDALFDFYTKLLNDVDAANEAAQKAWAATLGSDAIKKRTEKFTERTQAKNLLGGGSYEDLANLWKNAAINQGKNYQTDAEWNEYYIQQEQALVGGFINDYGELVITNAEEFTKYLLTAGIISVDSFQAVYTDAQRMQAETQEELVSAAQEGITNIQDSFQTTGKVAIADFTGLFDKLFQGGIINQDTYNNLIQASIAASEDLSNGITNSYEALMSWILSIVQDSLKIDSTLLQAQEADSRRAASSSYGNIISDAAKGQAKNTDWYNLTKATGNQKEYYNKTIEGADGLQADAETLLQVASKLVESGEMLASEAASSLAEAFQGSRTLGTYRDIENEIEKLTSKSEELTGVEKERLAVLKEMAAIYSQSPNDARFDFMNFDIHDGQIDNWDTFTKNISTGMDLITSAFTEGSKTSVREFEKLLHFIAPDGDMAQKIGETEVTFQQFADALKASMDITGQVDLSGVAKKLGVGMDDVVGAFDGGIKDVAQSQKDYWSTILDYLLKMKGLEDKRNINLEGLNLTGGTIELKDGKYYYDGTPYNTPEEAIEAWKKNNDPKEIAELLDRADGTDNDIISAEIAKTFGLTVAPEGVTVEEFVNGENFNIEFINAVGSYILGLLGDKTPIPLELRSLLISLGVPTSDIIWESTGEDGSKTPVDDATAAQMTNTATAAVDNAEKDITALLEASGFKPVDGEEGIYEYNENGVKLRVRVSADKDSFEILPPEGGWTSEEAGGVSAIVSEAQQTLFGILAAAKFKPDDPSGTKFTYTNDNVQLNAVINPQTGTVSISGTNLTNGTSLSDTDIVNALNSNGGLFEWSGTVSSLVATAKNSSYTYLLGSSHGAVKFANANLTVDDRAKRAQVLQNLLNSGWQKGANAGEYTKVLEDSAGNRIKATYTLENNSITLESPTLTDNSDLTSVFAETDFTFSNGTLSYKGITMSYTVNPGSIVIPNASGVDDSAVDTKTVLEDNGWVTKEDNVNVYYKTIDGKTVEWDIAASTVKVIDGGAVLEDSSVLSIVEKAFGTTATGGVIETNLTGITAKVKILTGGVSLVDGEGKAVSELNDITVNLSPNTQPVIDAINALDGAHTIAVNVDFKPRTPGGTPTDPELPTVDTVSSAAFMPSESALDVALKDYEEYGNNNAASRTAALKEVASALGEVAAAGGSLEEDDAEKIKEIISSVNELDASNGNATIISNIASSFITLGGVQTTQISTLSSFLAILQSSELLTTLPALSQFFTTISSTDLTELNFDEIVVQLSKLNDLDVDADQILNIASAISTLGAAWATLPTTDTDLTVSAKDNATGVIRRIQGVLDSLKDKTVKVNVEKGMAPVEIKVHFIPEGLWIGNVNDLGSALADGNVSKLLAGASFANKTLVGELGPELAVYNGRYHLLGQNGAEFVNLPSNAIVFNHKQTEGIVKGQTNIRGKALAEGNVSGPAAAGGIDGAIAAVQDIIAMWQGILNASAQQLANGGNGGGGGGGTAKAPTAELQEWYNLSREIARLEQEINTILAERKNLTDGREYLRNLRQQQDYLKTQLDTQKQLYDYQQAQLERQKKEINDNKVWSQFLTVDTDGRLRYKNGNETNGGKGALEVLADLNKMTLANQVKTVKGYGYKAYDNTGKDVTKDLSDEELVQHFFDDLQGQIDAYDALYDTVHATEQAMAELKTQIAEIDAEILQNTMDLETAIYDVIVKRWEKEIEKMEEYAEKVEEANEAYIDGLKEALDAEKDRYEKEQDDEELDQLQRRLNLLRRTGGSASEIADLEEKLNESLKEQYFDEQEKLIEELEKTNEEQIERLEQQITIQQETLEYQKEAGLIWNQVAEIMAKSEDEMNAWFQASNAELLGKSANELAKAVQDFAFMVGVYREDVDVWRPNYQKAQEDSKGKWEGQKGTDANNNPTYTAGEMWAKSDDSVLTSQLYDSLGDEQKQSIQDTYARTYANSIAAGKTEEEAKTDAYTAAEEMLNTFTGGTAKNSNTGKEMRYHYVYNIYKKDGTIYKHNGKDWEFKILGAEDNNGNAKTTTQKELENSVKARMKYVWTLGWTDETGIQNTRKQIDNAIASKGKTDVDSLKANYTKIWDAYQKSLASAKKRYNKAYGYRQGGLVDYTGPAIVHGTPSKPEAFLNAKQTAMISDAVRAAGSGNVLDNIRATLANLDSSIRSLVTNNINTQTSSITVAPGAVVLNVAKLNDSYDIEELSNDIMNRMVNIASKATNRGVNRR